MGEKSIKNTDIVCLMMFSKSFSCVAAITDET